MKVADGLINETEIRTGLFIIFFFLIQNRNPTNYDMFYQYSRKSFDAYIIYYLEYSLFFHFRFFTVSFSFLFFFFDVDLSRLLVLIFAWIILNSVDLSFLMIKPFYRNLPP